MPHGLRTNIEDVTALENESRRLKQTITITIEWETFMAVLNAFSNPSASLDMAATDKASRDLEQAAKNTIDNSRKTEEGIEGALCPPMQGVTITVKRGSLEAAFRALAHQPQPYRDAAYGIELPPEKQKAIREAASSDFLASFLEVIYNFLVAGATKKQ